MYVCLCTEHVEIWFFMSFKSYICLGVIHIEMSICMFI